MAITTSKFEWEKKLRGAALSDPEFRVLVILGTYADGQGRSAHPGRARLEADTGYSRNTVKKALRGLTAKGYLTLTAPGGHQVFRNAANVYELLDPPAPRGSSQETRGSSRDTQGGHLVTPHQIIAPDHQNQLHDHPSDDRKSCTTTNKFAAADLDADAPQTTPPTVHNVTDDPHEPSVAVAGAPEPGTTGAGNPGPFTVTQRMQLIRDIAAIAECEYQMSLTKDSDSATVADAGVRLAEATDYFAAHLIDMIGEDDYNDFYADYIDNGKWTFHPRCVDHYEAGKELNKLIHSVNKIYA